MLNRNFRLVFAGAALSAIGSAMVPVALSFAVLNAGRPAGVLGVVLAAQTLPAVILMLAGGVAGDLWPRRRLMISADLLRFAVQTALAAALIAGLPSMTLLVCLVALIGVGNAFFLPASGGLIAEIVDRDQLGRANGALRTANAMAMIVGPSLAGMIVMAVGPGWAIAIDGGSYAASALCLAFVVVPPRVASAGGAARSVGQDLRDGLRAFAERRWLWLSAVQFGVLSLTSLAPLMVLAPAMLAQQPDGPRTWGWLLSAIGAGALAGASACARRQPQRPLLALQFAAGGLAAPLLLLAAGAPTAAVLAGGAVFGAAAMAVNVLLITAIQQEVPGPLLSRVMSVIQLVSTGLTPAGYALAGPVAAWLGTGRALTAGACCVLASVAAMLAFSDIRRFGAPSRPAGVSAPV